MRTVKTLAKEKSISQAISELKPIDWFRVIADVTRTGISQNGIGRVTGKAFTQIHLYKVGRSKPSCDIADQLLNVWKIATGKSLDEVPRVRG